MNERCGKCDTVTPGDDGLSILTSLILTRALPVWHLYKGAVPAEVLNQLDRRGDWPLGVAGAAMERLSRDPELRDWLTVLRGTTEYE
jgi:hypothetical protein